MSVRVARGISVLLVSVVTLAGCDDGGRSELLVSAASSLTDALAEVEEAYETANPEVDVVLNLGGSSALREQILGGAPVDVFASANMENMEVIVDAGLTATAPEVFALNRLQIAVAPGNPAGIRGLDDFSREGPLLGLCAEGVPCGDFAREALASAGVDPVVDTNEPDVRSLLTKIETGELDAGIVYASDVIASQGTLEGIDIPESVDVLAAYPVAVLADAPQRGAGEDFVSFLLAAGGRQILVDHGFMVP